MKRNAVIQQLRKADVECYSRTQWKTARADAYLARRRTHPMPKGPANHHFLHITVTPDTDGVLDGAEGARRVESYGLSTPPMVSYHDLVTNEGKYFQGQDYGTKGTHTINDKNVPGFPKDLNLEGYALALMQNVEDDVTDIQVLVIAKVLAARELAGFVKKGARVIPHRTFAAKSCPGDKAVARLGDIQKLKDAYVVAGTIKSPTKPKKDRGEKVNEALANLQAAKGSGRRKRLINKAKWALYKIKPFN